MQGTSTANLPPLSRRQFVNKVQVDAANAQVEAANTQVESLRNEFAATIRRVDQLQGLLEEDQGSRPSKRTKADQMKLATLAEELSTLKSTHVHSMRELERLKSANERLLVDTHAHMRSIQDRRRRNLVMMSPTMMNSLTRLTKLGNTSTRR